MKDKLPNDRLEEFLRKSLEGHSEEPPGDLWSKIEANIAPQVEVVQPRLTPMRGWWAVAAAAAVVMGLLVGQQLYFTNKINQLSKQLEQNVEEMKQWETAEKRADMPHNEKSNEAVTLDETPSSTQNESVKNSGGTSETESHSTPNIPQKKSWLDKAQADVAEQIKATNAKANLEKRPISIDNVAKKSNTADLVNEDKNNAVIIDEPQDSKLETTEKIASGNTDLQPVWTKKLSLLDLPEATSLSVNPIIPASKLTGTHYSLGTNAMLMTTKSKISSVNPKKNPHNDDRKSFRLDEEKSKQSWMAGVAVEARVAPHFSLGTGLNYRVLDYQTTHQFDFDFKDRRHNGGPHEDHEHEFQYDLNTAAGTVEMDVRAVSTVSADDIPEGEKVEGEISTSQHFSYISWPIYANYSLGNGRLQALVKGGLLLNFLRDNQFSVGPIQSLNPKFDFSHQEGQSGSASDLQSVTVDYFAGVGLAYQLSRSLSLRLEPTIIGSLTSRHNNSRIQSSEFSAGLNAGLMYSF